MATSKVLVLGGGLSGMAAAYSLARAGAGEIVLVERGPELGGLAGTFEREGHFYPLGYHHILHRDRTLLYILEAIGAMPAVRWRKIRMFFRVGGKLYDLANPSDFARFPMSFMDKLRFARLMLKSFGKSDWSDWHDRSGKDLVDSWGGPGVRAALFEPLSRLKFELPCEEVSGAWLGARLHFREGSAPLGYIPQHNWTKVLCDGLTRLLHQQGIDVRLKTAVTKLTPEGDRLAEVDLSDGSKLRPDRVVSTIPTEIYSAMLPVDQTPNLAAIRYTAMISVICAMRQKIEPDFYWMNLASLDRSACGIFLLNSLNPTIGESGDSCVNFVTHLRSRENPFFHKTDEELMAGYREDFRQVFGFDMNPFWTHITRLPMYSPVFYRNYQNPPIRSGSLRNVYFAGNYRTFPSVVSTGTAMKSGLEAAHAMLEDSGRLSPMLGEANGYRLRGMPRG